VGSLNLKIIAFNDFHGHLAPPSGNGGLVNVSVLSDGGIQTVAAGGAAFFAKVIADLRAATPHSVVVSAGDLIGGTPLLSKAFADEPTLTVMDAIGLDIAGVGNHEFDEGLDELLRLQSGRCRAQGCFDAGVAFQMPRFQFIGANVQRLDGGYPLARYAVKTYEGTKVAFVGMTLEGTAGVLAPKGSAGLRFLNEVETVNRLVPELRAQGIRAVVVILHEGGVQTTTAPLFNGCAGLSGPIVRIVNALDPEVDLVVSGHTHAAYNCQCFGDGGCAAPTPAATGGRRVTSALAFGRLVSDIDLTLDRNSGDVVGIRSTNRVVERDAGLPSVAALIDTYSSNSEAVRGRRVGSISQTLSAQAADAGEVPLGLVIADAQLEATRTEGAVAAFMNSGGVRADIVFRDAGIATSAVTYEDLFNAQPFGNLLVTMTLTGAQLMELLNQQFSPTRTRILQVSTGFSFTWALSGDAGMRIDRTSVRLNGIPLADDATYRVTVNNFMAAGGDNYAVLTQGTNRVLGPVDLDALEAFFADAGVVAAPTPGRIRVIPTLP
jgi:5'-nucleotidase